jgi:pyrroline-5-carboxylate reductase
MADAIADNHMICFLGAGSMAEAMIAGVIRQGVCRPEQITAVNRGNRERLSQLRQKYGIIVDRTKERAVREANVLILAAKPKDMAQALQEIADWVGPDTLVISVAAGLSLSWLEGELPEGTAVIRAMPNTSAAVSLSVTAMAAGRHAGERETALAGHFLSSIGRVFVVDESQMDAVTGLAGSGPAYFYYMIEAMVEAGIEAGLPLDMSRDMALLTMAGAAEMLKATGEAPEALRRKVTSPGGTTQAGIEALEQAGFSQTVISAVLRAAARSQEMGVELVKQ